MPLDNITFGNCFIALVLVFLVHKLISLARNIQQAKSTGLPYTLVPFSEVELLGKLLCPFARKIWAKRLLNDDGWPKWIRLSIMAWQWEDKGRAHDEYGDVFLVVSPHSIVCYSADANMAWDVMNRRHEFIKPRDQAEPLEIYGPNIGTTEGSDFARHLRITGPAFADATGINDVVWTETCLLTRSMANGVFKQGKAHNFASDIRRLTLGVICLTGFGQKVDFEAEASGAKSTIPEGFVMSLYNSLRLVTANVIPIFLVAPWILRLLGKAEIPLSQEQLEKHMRAIVRTETAKLEQCDEKAARSKPNLLTSILRASAHDAVGTGRKQAFTENEVLGSIFAFLLAGYETTSGTITYGLILLALLPEVQDKLCNEVDQAYQYAAAAGRIELSYAEDFSKLNYMYGYMYEVLRLFPSLAGIKKQVINRPVPITVFPQDATNFQSFLPADSVVVLNSSAVHYSERYWPDANEVKPERWSEDVGLRPIDEQLEEQGQKRTDVDRARKVKATMQTFSCGGRACIGRRYAQSEFVALFATLLRDYRVELEEGVDRVALKHSIGTLSAGSLTLSPMDSVSLVLKKRRE